MPEPAGDVLTRERIHLSESRAALQRMRRHAASLEAFGGDHVSTEHLKQALYRRMKALEDDPTVPLFFGRLDYDASSAPNRTRGFMSDGGTSPARLVASRS
jgi:hypothetical protein